MHCRLFCSILSLYPLEASSDSLPIVKIENDSRHYQMSSEGQNSSHLKTTESGPKYFSWNVEEIEKRNNNH